MTPFNQGQWVVFVLFCFMFFGAGWLLAFVYHTRPYDRWFDELRNQLKSQTKDQYADRRRQDTERNILGRFKNAIDGRFPGRYDMSIHVGSCKVGHLDVEIPNRGGMVVMVSMHSNNTYIPDITHPIDIQWFKKLEGRRDHYCADQAWIKIAIADLIAHLESLPV